MQPQGLSYKAHWEALGCALCLLNTPEISGTGPMRSRGFCPDSRPPACSRAVSGVGLGLFVWGGGGLPRSPGPRLFVGIRMFVFFESRHRNSGTPDEAGRGTHSQNHPCCFACVNTYGGADHAAGVRAERGVVANNANKHRKSGRRQRIHSNLLGGYEAEVGSEKRSQAKLQQLPPFSPWADQSRRRCWCGTSHRSAPSSDGSAHTYQVSRTRRQERIATTVWQRSVSPIQTC